MTLSELRGVGVVEADGVGSGVDAAFGGEAAGLVDEFLGEVEGGEVAVAEVAEAEGHPAGAAAGFEQRGGAVGKETFDQGSLGSPKAQFMRGTRVMQDRQQIVEIGADGGGGNFFGGG